ncbi:DUF6232 family protein [Kitasatospora sp. NPDC087314]|uniref:DUF6232 family protein n=1 Tax=Kitasatospora sp. NPDC087314 TaxID=3364068 RepID=UPI00381E25A5
MIDVRVSRRVLWVGGDAYPLHNIARARQFKLLPPKRSRVIIRFVRQVIGLLVAAAVLGALLGNGASQTTTKNVLGLVVLALLLAFGYRLVKQLRMRTVYQLIIETSSSSNTAVVSYDAQQVGNLIQLIMEAIDNPQAEFAIQVENVHIGDQINQYGDHNTGKRASV